MSFLSERLLLSYADQCKAVFPYEQVVFAASHKIGWLLIAGAVWDCPIQPTWRKNRWRLVRTITYWGLSEGRPYPDGRSYICARITT